MVLESRLRVLFVGRLRMSTKYARHSVTSVCRGGSRKSDVCRSWQASSAGASTSGHWMMCSTPEAVSSSSSPLPTAGCCEQSCEEKQ